jgi:hypothetical protein
VNTLIITPSIYLGCRLGRIHISWLKHSLLSFMPLHHVKSHYNLILYYTSTYVERVGVSIWIKCDKRQMTSCVHKMCERMYGQTNMKRSITLAKINHPWNRFFMFVWPYVRSQILCTQLVICLLSHFIHIWYLGWPWSEHAHIRYQIWIKCDKRQMTSCVHKIGGRTYGQTNMKRAITLAKINHLWNRYNMHMLRSWPTKIH